MVEPAPSRHRIVASTLAAAGVIGLVVGLVMVGGTSKACVGGAPTCLEAGTAAEPTESAGPAAAAGTEPPATAVPTTPMAAPEPTTTPTAAAGSLATAAVPTATPGPPPAVSLHATANTDEASSRLVAGSYRGAEAVPTPVRAVSVEAGFAALVCSDEIANDACRYLAGPVTEVFDTPFTDAVTSIQVRAIGEPWRLSPAEHVGWIVDLLPARATIVLEAGVHTGQVITPKSGMTIAGEHGAVLDGQSISQPAIRGTAESVTVRGLEIRNYEPGPYNGAISARRMGVFTDGTGWTIENNHIHHNRGAGINVASGMTIRDNDIHDNGQIGISGIGSDDALLADISIIDNRIAHNGYEPYDWNHHEGGIKINFAVRLVVRGNTVVDNRSVGIYCDLRSRDVVIEGNTVRTGDHHTQSAGIFVEISQHVVVRNNEITGLLAATGTQSWDINIAESQHVEVTGNTIFAGSNVVGTHHGIQWRNCCERDPGREIVFHDNTVVARAGTAIVGQRESIETGPVTWTSNRYAEQGGSIEFRHRGESHSWETWRALGHDADGSFN